MSVTAESLDILDAYRAAGVRIQDEQTRAMVAAWADAWDVVADELQGAIDDLVAGGVAPSNAKVRRSRHPGHSPDANAAQLQDVARQAGVVIVGDLPTALTLAGQANAALVSSQLPPTTGATLLTSWDRIDKRALAAIINRTAERIHALSIPLTDEAIASM